MSTPSPWSQPPRPSPGAQPSGPPPGYTQQQQVHGPAQQYGQQAVPQPLPYGPPVSAGQYAGSTPLPYAPKPEKPLVPAVWWALVINLVVTVLVGGAMLLIGWAFLSVLTESADGAWADDASGGAPMVVLVVAAVMLGSLLVSWGLTVGALVLWRLLRGFRTIPAFVQALVAYVTMWVVTTVVSFVLQLVLGAFGAFAGGTTSY